MECDYEPDHDEFFLRSGTLVIIKGGKSAADAAIRQKAAMIGKTVEVPQSDDSGSEIIQVRAYDLIAHYGSR